MTIDVVVALAVAALCLSLLIAWILRERRREAALAEGLRARGWRVTPIERGTRVEGGESVPWTLDTVRGKRHTTFLWEAPAAPTDGVVFVGPRVSTGILDLNSALVRFALQALLGEEARHLAGAAEVAIGSPAFRERFMVIASSAGHAEALFDADVEAAVLQSPPQTVVLRWQDRLQVRPAQASTIDEIVAVVTLGEAVARRCGYG